MQSINPSQQQAKPARREALKFKQFISPVQDEPFYDDSLFFDKRNIFSLINPPQKKIKTIYDKIIISNRSDPLHPSSYRKYESNRNRYDGKNKACLHSDKIYNTTKKFNMDYSDFQRAQMLNFSINSKSISKDQQAIQKDRKKFFKNLLKKFTENVQQQNSINYKQKINLFKKIFQHYKIRPQEKQHFAQLLKKISQKQMSEVYATSKISTKITLQSRRNNYSVSQQRSESPKQLRFRFKQKSVKTSQYRRTLKQKSNFSQMLTIKSKGQKQDVRETKNISNLSNNKELIEQLERELSARKALNYNTLQQDSKQIFSSGNNSQNRAKAWEKKIQLNLNQINKTQTPIDIKLQKFRQFLFAVNFGNNLFVPLQTDKYQTPFKIYIGRGNNSNLIKAIFKKRFWFQITKNITQANFVWTQLKQQSLFQSQKPKNYILEEEISKKLSENQISFSKIHDQQIKQIQENPEAEANGQTIQLEKQASHIIDLKVLKMKKKPQLSKFMSVQSQRRYQSIKKANQSLEKSNPATIQQKLVKVKKHPQILLLKSMQSSNQNPLFRILSSFQMSEYDRLYGKKLKDTFRPFGNKMAYFNQRKNDFLNSPNGYIMKQEQKRQSVIHNHLQFNGILGNKKAMFYILKQYCQLSNLSLFNIVPLTFHIKNGLKDQNYKKFAQQFQNRKKNKIINYWVMKPGQFSNRGNGIQCTNKIQQIRKRVQSCLIKTDPKKTRKIMGSKSVILQSYITNPLLYNGRKFDIRAYMMTTIVNGKIKAYWYQEGYIRTSSYVWSLSQISDRQIHLTNDAVQKHSETYGKYQMGNKLSYRDIQRYLETYQKASKNVFYEKILPQMKQIATLSLKASYLFLDPQKLQNNFEIFGFDFMLDSKLKPWLIQINTNPCLELGCPILQRVIPNMLQNAFRIAIDPLFPPPSSFSSNYKYNIAQNAANYNKFYLIFDEGRDGPAIRKLYQNKNLQEILTKIQDIQQDKETFQEDGQQIDLPEQQ